MRMWSTCLLFAFATCAAFAQTPEIRSSPVTLLFAGDTTLDSTPGALIKRGVDPFKSFSPLFAAADVRLLNLECVVATTGQAIPKHYTFRASPHVLQTLKRHVDGVTLANNHSGDYGHQAFSEMLTLLSKNNIAQTGGGMNLNEAHTPWIVERHGIRIAILSYNEFMPRSYEAGSHTPGVAWSEDEQVVDDIRRARRVHQADIVLPFMHWGWENEPKANLRQRQLAKKMIDAGADAIIGGHPHVTQDLEFYKGKPIIYSVGNFIMKETDNDRQREGWVLRLKIEKTGIHGFDTHVTRINSQGIPFYDKKTPSPCWTNTWHQERMCLAGDPQTNESSAKRGVFR
jgi:poly-gamma-glutamate capsule biosynthesis protein CapA/YwtB (metallophosphatase superfamily)